MSSGDGRGPGCSFQTNAHSDPKGASAPGSVGRHPVPMGSPDLSLLPPLVTNSMTVSDKKANIVQLHAQPLEWLEKKPK